VQARRGPRLSAHGWLPAACIRYCDCSAGSPRRREKRRRQPWRTCTRFRRIRYSSTSEATALRPRCTPSPPWPTHTSRRCSLDIFRGSPTTTTARTSSTAMGDTFTTCSTSSDSTRQYPRRLNLSTMSEAQRDELCGGSGVLWYARLQDASQAFRRAGVNWRNAAEDCAQQRHQARGARSDRSHRCVSSSLRWGAPRLSSWRHSKGVQYVLTNNVTKGWPRGTQK